MQSLARLVIVIAGVCLIGSAIPGIARFWLIASSNGMETNYDGVVTAVRPRSAAARLSIVPKDRVLAPLPHDLLRDPPPPISFQLMHAGAIRPVDLVPLPRVSSPRERTRAILRFVTYLVFFMAGAALLWRKPSALAWTFFLYCASRRFAELGVYWPGSDDLFWTNLLLFATFGGANSAFAASFALRLWRESGRPAVDAVVLPAGAVLAVGWFCVMWLVAFGGRPSQDLAGALNWLTATVFLSGAAIAAAALISRDRPMARFPLLWAIPIAFVAQAAAVMPLPSIVADTLDAVAVVAPLASVYVFW